MLLWFFLFYESEITFSLADALNKPDALLYKDIVDPLLQARCTNCHGSTKQKGKLRLDNPEFILKGVKGKTVIPGNANDSELIYHVQLSLDDEDHMPPKEKKQLTESEIELLIMWIDTGAKFEGKVSELLSEEKLQQIGRTSTPTKVSEIPDVSVSAANPAIIQKLSDAGVAITPIESGSNFLSVNFISVPENASNLLADLPSIKENIVWLKLSGCKIDDAALNQIKDFNNLTRLNLDGTNITDEGMGPIVNLKQLIYLNLKGTSVTLTGIEKLKSLSNLKNLFLYQTKISESEQENIKTLLVGVKIDFGNYVVPMLVSDTSKILGR